jgi:hypothetical protein
MLVSAPPTLELDDMEALLPSAIDLARFQFAFTVVWHFLFPAFTIGLASYLAVLEALWLWTGKAVYIDTFRYWLKIFAVAFAMGVVSGIVMSYQFGTNWSVFADKTAPVLGPLLGYEVLTAFFLEAGFLGVMLFGMDRVGRGLHFLATALVAGGTLMSAFWILSANSWMHTPRGYSVSADGPIHAGKLVGDRLQPVLPLPLRPHRHGRVSHHGHDRGRGRRLASPEKPRKPAGPADVLHGHVDGHLYRAAPARPRRPPRHQHLRTSAGQGGGDGRAFRDGARGAVDPDRLAGRGSCRHPLRTRYPEARQPLFDPRLERRGQRPEGVPA